MQINPPKSMNEDGENNRPVYGHAQLLLTSQTIRQLCSLGAVNAPH